MPLYLPPECQNTLLPGKYNSFPFTPRLLNGVYEVVKFFKMCKKVKKMCIVLNGSIGKSAHVKSPLYKYTSMTTH